MVVCCGRKRNHYRSLPGGRYLGTSCSSRPTYKKIRLGEFPRNIGNERADVCVREFGFGVYRLNAFKIHISCLVGDAQLILVRAEGFETVSYGIVDSPRTLGSAKHQQMRPSLAFFFGYFKELTAIIEDTSQFQLLLTIA